MSDIARVYHPTVNSWEDVPTSAVGEWAELGWTEKPGKHIDDSDSLPVGEFFVPSPARYDEPRAASDTTSQATVAKGSGK